MEELSLVRDQLIQEIEEYIHDNPKLTHLQLDRDTKVSFLAQGEYNINFILHSQLQKYVFRVNIGSQLEIDNQIRYEYNSLQYLEASGVTAKVYFVDDTLSYFRYGILIMEFLEGVPLDYGKDLEKAAFIFSKIHALKIEEPIHFIVEKNIFTDRIKEGERLLSNVWDSPYVDKKIKSFFHQFLDWAKMNQRKEQYFIDEPWHVINNTEVNSHNFIIGKERSYLIDWEKPVISDPAQDLTQFLAPTTTLWKTKHLLSQEEKDYFLKSYIASLNGENRNITERIHLYTPYLYLRALAWCAYAYVEYHDPNKQIKNMDTYEKIKKFLDEYLMKNLCSPFWY